MTVGDLKRLFGTAIKSKRSELGISQEELADRAGHRTYVSDVERGARNLSLESIDIRRPERGARFVKIGKNRDGSQRSISSKKRSS